MIDGKTIKCSRVFLKQETKASDSITVSESNIPKSNGNQAINKIDNKQSHKGRKIKTSKALDGSIACTKKTRESSGSSSEDHEDFNNYFNHEDDFQQHYSETSQFDYSNGFHSPQTPTYGFFKRNDEYANSLVYDQSNYYDGSNQHYSGVSFADPIGWPAYRSTTEGFPGYIAQNPGVYAACKSERQKAIANINGSSMWSQTGGPFINGSNNSKNFEQSNACMSVPAKASKMRSYYRMF